MILTLLAACEPASPSGGADSEAPYVDVRPANPTCVAPARPVSTASVAVEAAFDGRTFTRPTGLYPPPTPEGWWTVIEQKGSIYRFKEGDATAAVRVADVSGLLEAASGEEGLLGLAYAPDFETSGTVYLSYTSLDGEQLVSRIARVHSPDAGLTFDLGTLEVIFQLDQPFANHNGGNIAFGPDGYLYAGYGDGGSGGDPYGNGQNTDVLLGKMLRLSFKPLGWRTQHWKWLLPSAKKHARRGKARPGRKAKGPRTPRR